MATVIANPPAVGCDMLEVPSVWNVAFPPFGWPSSMKFTTRLQSSLGLPSTSARAAP